MTMPKKGTRRIVVDDVPHRWAASETWYTDPDNSAETHGWYRSRLRVTVTVERESDGRFRLLAAGDFPNTIMVDDYPETGVIRPRHVAALISYARQQGWPDSTPAIYEVDCLTAIIHEDPLCGSFGSVHDS